MLVVIIALLSLVPSSSMPESSLFAINSLDKIVHFSMYAFLGFVALMESHSKIDCLRYHLLLIFTIFSLSAIIEVLQATVVATRSAEWLDLLANATGLLAGYFAFRFFRTFKS